MRAAGVLLDAYNLMGCFLSFSNLISSVVGCLGLAFRGYSLGYTVTAAGQGQGQGQGRADEESVARLTSAPRHQMTPC